MDKIWKCGSYPADLTLNIIVRPATRSRSGELGRIPKILSLPVFRQMSASECSLSNEWAVSADEVKCPTSLEPNQVRGLGQDC